MATPMAPRAARAPERDAIEAAVLDYIEGWYEGAPQRMERSLHPQLAKRLVAPERGGSGNAVHELSAEALIGYVRERAGSAPPAVQLKELVVLDIYGDVATARAEMNDWVDYLHLGRFEDGWRIVNVIWALKPREEAL